MPDSSSDKSHGAKKSNSAEQQVVLRSKVISHVDLLQDITMRHGIAGEDLLDARGSLWLGEMEDISEDLRVAEEQAEQSIKLEKEVFIKTNGEIVSDGFMQPEMWKNPNAIKQMEAEGVAMETSNLITRLSQLQEPAYLEYLRAINTKMSDLSTSVRVCLSSEGQAISKESIKELDYSLNNSVLSNHVVANDLFAEEITDELNSILSAHEIELKDELPKKLLRNEPSEEANSGAVISGEDASILKEYVSSLNDFLSLLHTELKDKYLQEMKQFVTSSPMSDLDYSNESFMSLKIKLQNQMDDLYSKNEQGSLGDSEKLQFKKLQNMLPFILIYNAEKLNNLMISIKKVAKISKILHKHKPFSMKDLLEVQKSILERIKTHPNHESIYGSNIDLGQEKICEDDKILLNTNKDILQQKSDKETVLIRERVGIEQLAASNQKQASLDAKNTEISAIQAEISELRQNIATQELENNHADNKLSRLKSSFGAEQHAEVVEYFSKYDAEVERFKYVVDELQRLKVDVDLHVSQQSKVEQKIADSQASFAKDPVNSRLDSLSFKVAYIKDMIAKTIGKVERESFKKELVSIAAELAKIQEKINLYSEASEIEEIKTRVEEFLQEVSQEQDKCNELDNSEEAIEENVRSIERELEAARNESNAEQNIVNIENRLSEERAKTVASKIVMRNEAKASAYSTKIREHESILTAETAATSSPEETRVVNDSHYEKRELFILQLDAKSLKKELDQHGKKIEGHYYFDFNQWENAFRGKFKEIFQKESDSVIKVEDFFQEKCINKVMETHEDLAVEDTVLQNCQQYLKSNRWKDEKEKFLALQNEAQKVIDLHDKKQGLEIKSSLLGSEIAEANSNLSILRDKLADSNDSDKEELEGEINIEEAKMKVKDIRQKRLNNDLAEVSTQLQEIVSARDLSSSRDNGSSKGSLSDARLKYDSAKKEVALAKEKLKVLKQRSEMGNFVLNSIKIFLDLNREVTINLPDLPKKWQESILVEIRDLFTNKWLNDDATNSLKQRLSELRSNGFVGISSTEMALIQSLLIFLPSSQLQQIFNWLEMSTDLLQAEIDAPDLQIELEKVLEFKEKLAAVKARKDRLLITDDALPQLQEQVSSIEDNLLMQEERLQDYQQQVAKFKDLLPLLNKLQQSCKHAQQARSKTTLDILYPLIQRQEQIKASTSVEGHDYFTTALDKLKIEADSIQVIEQSAAVNVKLMSKLPILISNILGVFNKIKQQVNSLNKKYKIEQTQIAEFKNFDIEELKDELKNIEEYSLQGEKDKMLSLFGQAGSVLSQGLDLMRNHFQADYLYNQMLGLRTKLQSLGTEQVGEHREILQKLDFYAEFQKVCLNKPEPFRKMFEPKPVLDPKAEFYLVEKMMLELELEEEKIIPKDLFSFLQREFSPDSVKLKQEMLDKYDLVRQEVVELMEQNTQSNDQSNYQSEASSESGIISGKNGFDVALQSHASFEMEDLVEIQKKARQAAVVREEQELHWQFKDVAKVFKDERSAALEEYQRSQLNKTDETIGETGEYYGQVARLQGVITMREYSQQGAKTLQDLAQTKCELVERDAKKSRAHMQGINQVIDRRRPRS